MLRISEACYLEIQFAVPAVRTEEHRWEHSAPRLAAGGEGFGVDVHRRELAAVLFAGHLQRKGVAPVEMADIIVPHPDAVFIDSKPLSKFICEFKTHTSGRQMVRPALAAMRNEHRRRLDAVENLLQPSEVLRIFRRDAPVGKVQKMDVSFGQSYGFRCLEGQITALSYQSVFV